MTNQDDREGQEGTGPNGSAPETKPEAAETPEEPTVEPTEQQVARLEREKGEIHDRMLRVAADFENYKKRARREIEDASVRARESLLREILPVVDNLERAEAAVAKGGTLESLAQGVKLVTKQLTGALEKFEIRGFESLGQAFDPARHEAIQQVETTEYPSGSVALVFARGYTIGDRLLRPAMVAVAKAPPGEPVPPGDGESPAGASDQGEREGA